LMSKEKYKTADGSMPIILVEYLGPHADASCYHVNVAPSLAHRLTVTSVKPSVLKLKFTAD
jgi:hypothetical protein